MVKEPLKIIARCERCGRGFITMPKDGIDSYFPANIGHNLPTNQICGGKVKPIGPNPPVDDHGGVRAV